MGCLVLSWAYEIIHCNHINNLIFYRVKNFDYDINIWVYAAVNQFPEYKDLIEKYLLLR